MYCALLNLNTKAIVLSHICIKQYLGVLKHSALIRLRGMNLKVGAQFHCVSLSKDVKPQYRRHFTYLEHSRLLR